MSHIEDAARLSRHRKAAEDEVNLTPGPYYPIHMNYQVEIGMHDEWLLAVAGKFQKGDLAMLRAIIKSMEKTDYDAYRIDCLRRMAEAAAMMEAEP